MNKFFGIFGAIWGFAGSVALIGYALWRLTPIAIDSLNYSMNALQWTLLIGNTLFMAYSEGYKGFQLAFSPRLAARSLYLANNPTLVRVLFAPFFVFGYFDAIKKRLIVTYALTAMIVCFIILMGFLDQPWRGILDAGVVVGLFWGLLSMLYFIVIAITADNYDISPDISPKST